MSDRSQSAKRFENLKLGLTFAVAFAALLGAVPLDIATREAGDRGMPIVIERPDHPISKVFEKIADQLRKRIESATNN